MPTNTAEASAGPLPSAPLVRRQPSTSDSAKKPSDTALAISRQAAGASMLSNEAGSISQAITAVPQLLATT